MCDFCEKKNFYLWGNAGDGYECSCFSIEDNSKLECAIGCNGDELIGSINIKYCPICGRKLSDTDEESPKPYGYVVCDQFNDDDFIGFYSTLDEVKRCLGGYLDDHMLDEGEFSLLTVSKGENIKVKVTHSVEFI